MKFIIIFTVLFSICACDIITTNKNIEPKLITPITYDQTDDVYIDNYNLELSDNGPTLGIICYINPNADQDGWKYIEVSNNSLDLATYFEVTFNYIGNTKSEIGTGRNNTEIIAMEGLSTSSAADLCKEYSSWVDGEEYNDWFLPSINEIELIYNNSDISDYSTALNYWSSTEENTTDAYCFNFGTGEKIISLKSKNLYVRPIRRF